MLVYFVMHDLFIQIVWLTVPLLCVVSVHSMFITLLQDECLENNIVRDLVSHLMLLLAR